MNTTEQRAIVKWIKIVVLRTLKEKNLTRLDVGTLISAGMLGYSQARTRFDASRNVKFKTFAEYRIKGAVLDEVRKMIGDERAKTPRAKRIEDYDYELISDENDMISHIDSGIDVDATLIDAGLSDRDIEIIRCRIEGYSIRELASQFKFSESRASQILFRIKKSLHTHYQGQFSLKSVVCPLCSKENLISDKSKEFRCDHCDESLMFENGKIVRRLIEVEENEEIELT